MFKHYKYLVAILLACVSLQSQAAANKIENFDAQTWRRMQKDLPRPAVVIFSTTDCGHCPAIIAAMAEQINTRKPQVPLIVVVMDGAGHADLLQEPHYQPANRLFVFNGNTAALQYGISPNWRGITPYVALLPRVGEMKLVMGKPSALEIDTWLATSKVSTK
jgi:hypothetical protein